MGNLITLTEVKTEINETSSDNDTLLNSLIDAVESIWDSLTGRTWYETTHTEYFDIEKETNMIALTNYPIVSVDSIYEDSDREYNADDLLDSDDYAVDEVNGIITFDYDLEIGPKALKVAYTAGYKDGSTYSVPDWLKQILIRQVAFWFNQSKNHGWDVSRFSQPGGSISIMNNKDNFLPDFTIMVDMYKDKM